MKKYQLLFLVSTALFGDYTDEILDRYNQQISSEERDSCSQEQEVAPNECDASLDMLDYTEPCTSFNCGLMVSADFILWTPRISNISFAATNEEVLEVSSLNVKTGQVLHPNWSLNPGFRVGLGWYSESEGWLLSGRYTWIRFSNSMEKPRLKDGQEIISGLGSPFILTETSKGKFDFGFNVVDIEIAKSFCVDSCLFIDTHFGLKTQWQNYRFKLEETGESITSRHFAISEELFKNDTWGVGIRGGFRPRWYFSRCFSLYSGFAATAQWQHFATKGIVQFLDQVTGKYSSLLDVRDGFFLVTPVFEADVGLRWENWYCCERYHIVAKLGWEVQWWGKQNQFISYFTETRDGDMGLQGLTLSLDFDF